MRTAFKIFSVSVICLVAITSPGCSCGGGGGGSGVAGTTYYADNDGDGFGDPANTSFLATPQAGFTLDNTDCDDTDPSMYPGAADTCDGVDNDCDGQIDESGNTVYYRDIDGDGHGNSTTSTLACTQPSGYVTSGSDCNDGDASIFPSATEICDNKDNDCDGQIDSGVTRQCYMGPPGTAGVGVCSAGSQTCSGGTWGSCTGQVLPGMEICNNLDDNCDGATDEDYGAGGTVKYMDWDGGMLAKGDACGTGACAGGTVVCGASPLVLDCTTVGNAGPEVCDGGDNDCNGLIDEVFDLMTDENHCGTCGNACPSNSCVASPTCFNGTCVNEGIVVITEVMIDPVNTAENDGEWVELYNPTGEDIDISGWNLYDDNADSHAIATATPIVIPAGGYALLAVNDDVSLNCGVTADYQYSDFTLANTDDQVVLEVSGCEVDRVNYNTAFVVPGSAKNLDAGTTDAVSNDTLSNWCDGTTPLVCGDTGTPGSANISCP